MTDSETPIVIVGAGPQGRIIREVCIEANLSMLGFLDDTHAPDDQVDGGRVIGGFGLIGDRSLLREARFIVALGASAARLELSNRISGSGGRLASVMHPWSAVSPSAVLGPGSFVNFATAVYAGARVGRALILDTHASIGHDSDIADGVFIGPGARITGNVRCGAGTFVGAAAVVLPGIAIGDGVTVGAGAVVTRDVPNGAIVAGNPARQIGSKTKAA